MKMYYLNLHYNLIFFLILISKVKDKEIDYEPIGRVYTINFKNSKFQLNFNSDKKLLIHFLSIDCQIQLNEINNKEVNVYKISNYNFNAYYISLMNSSYKFEISPLIDSIKRQNQDRNYHLIINSIKIEPPQNTPELP